MKITTILTTLARTTSRAAKGLALLGTSAVSALVATAASAPTAVWVSGEFADAASEHAGYTIATNASNTIDYYGRIVIGDAATIGATIALPSGTYSKASVLVKYEIPSGGAPVANAVIAGSLDTSTHAVGAISTAKGGVALTGYWRNGSGGTLTTSGYAFANSPAVSYSGGEGYLLYSYDSDSGTKVYLGNSLTNLLGGANANLKFSGRTIETVSIGGPHVAGAKPWAGMMIKGVALFAGAFLEPNDVKAYAFPDVTTAPPEDPERYAVEPVAVWYRDFKTTAKGAYALSVGGTTSVADDAYGSSLTIGDAAAVINTAAAASGELTVLIKYSAAPMITSAPVVAFGGTANNGTGLDVGLYTKSDKVLAVYRNFLTDNSKPYSIPGDAAKLSAAGGYLLCARKREGASAYAGSSLAVMAGGEKTYEDLTFTYNITSVGIGGNSPRPANANDMVPFTGFVIEKIAVFNGYYTPAELVYVEGNPEDGTVLTIAPNTTWNFAAGETRTYSNIGTLEASGTIAITNAATLSEGTYTLATWTTPQIMSSGYGRVGTLTTEGLPSGLTAELVYGVKAICLRVYDAAVYAARPKFKIMPYGDSITEGFNLGDSKANYRVLLGQKLAMLGYNVEMVGCYNKIQSRYGTDSFFDAIDPSGAVATNIWQWHSAKHGATLGVTALTSWQRSALTENVDTISAMAGRPDVVLLLGGINDLSPGFDAPETVFGNWTNVVSRLVKNLPDTKIVVTTTLHAGPGRTDSLNTNADNFNALVKSYINDMPVAWSGHVYFVDLCNAVKSAEAGVISSDNLHPDWLGDDQMAEGWLSVITNLYPSAEGVFPSSTPLPSVSSSELGAAAKSELDDYRDGYKLCRTITPTGNIDTSNPYSATGDGVTNGIEKVAYFVEYVRADNNAHKWVWVDMDAFGDCDLASVGLPAASRQQVVTKLHVKSNHNGIDDVAANDDTVSGWIEFSPYDYTGDPSGVEGAPLRHGAATGSYTMFDWDDTLLSSGSMGSMQVFRKATPSGRSAQVLFAYNNWRSSTKEAEFGVGNFAQHFWGGVQTLDYTYTKGLAKMNAAAYSVKTIEIWTKPTAKATSTTGFPVPYSWLEACFPGIEGQDDARYENAAKSDGDNGYAYWESYVLGLEPTNATSKFTAAIRMDGSVPIVEYSPTNEVLKASGAIEYRLQGRPTLTNEWENRPSFSEPGEANRFFRVKIIWGQEGIKP